MFDAPLDTVYVWVGLGAVSLAVAGTVLSFPTTSPAAAGAVADAVDTIAASDHEARDGVAVPAGEMRLGPRALALRTPDGTAHARFAYGPVVPVREGPLRQVLLGTPPEDGFDDRTAFRRALERARSRDPVWRETPERLHVRRVSWGEVNGTLVG